MAQKAKQKRQDSSIDGWLLAWVIATIVIIVINVTNNFQNPIGWIMNTLLAINLIMVYKAEGSRWVMVVTGLLFGSFFLYAAMTVTPASMCLSNIQACAGLGKAGDDILMEMATRAMAGGIALSTYMFVSAAYFAMSKRVIVRFGK